MYMKNLRSEYFKILRTKKFAKRLLDNIISFTQGHVQSAIMWLSKSVYFAASFKNEVALLQGLYKKTALH